MIIMLSDLHLGTGDELEDFLLWGDSLEGTASHLRLRARLELHEAFAAFLVGKMAQATSAGLLPTLLLLGDTFDFWHNQRPRERPHRTLDRILSAHVEVVGALRHWLAAGGGVELVLGASDQSLVDAHAWAELSDALPGLNARRKGRPAHYFADEATGLYAEHGYRWDPGFRFRNRANWRVACAGRDIIRRVLTPLEPLFPWIDKAANLADALRLVQQTVRPHLRREAALRLGESSKTPRGLLRLVEPWLRGRLINLDGLERKQEHLQAHHVERLVRRKANASLAPLPAHCRYFAAGHTHVAQRVRNDSAQAEYLNPGSWKPVAELGEHARPRIVQPLPYGQLIPDGQGGWEASVRSWSEEWEQLKQS